ncbi:unnamed protein product [Callosobruchus maculatus]|uniref:Uncharacterized protein n=1 Tax=Callosobruchus maculatus TaxID=64391 RepID=A0A653CFP3_CALMS|nr:unnamed protein product [Callosobruchus maculatus]
MSSRGDESWRLFRNKKDFKNVESVDGCGFMNDVREGQFLGNMYIYFRT